MTTEAGKRLLEYERVHQSFCAFEFRGCDCQALADIAAIEDEAVADLSLNHDRLIDRMEVAEGEIVRLRDIEEAAANLIWILPKKFRQRYPIAYARLADALDDVWHEDQIIPRGPS